MAAALTLAEQMKAEAQAVAERKAKQQTFEKVNWYKPKEGENFLRLLPHWESPQDKLFFTTVTLHFGIEVPKNDGTGSIAIAVRCPRMKGKPCDVCDLWEHVQKDKPSRDAMNAVRPIERYLYNILSLNRPVTPGGEWTGEFYVWAMPTTVHQTIFLWIEELGSSPADLKLGRGWKLIKEVDKRKSAAQGTKYMMTPQISASELQPKFVEKMSTSMINLDNLYQDEFPDAIAKTALTMRMKLGITVPVGKLAAATAVAFAGLGGTGTVDDGFSTLPPKAVPAATPGAVPATSAAVTAALPGTMPGAGTMVMADEFATLPPKAAATVTVADDELAEELKRLGV